MTNYNNQGFKDNKEESKMYQNGKVLSEGPAKPPVKPKESFFKMTLKAAIMKAFRSVVVPTAKRFIDDVFEDTKNSLLYGDERPSVFNTTQHTPYREISTRTALRLQAPYKEAPKMTDEDHFYQRYEKCRVATEEEAFQILNKFYQKLRTDGKITLAYYYQQFKENYTFQDETWGWKSMTGADAEQTATGYRIIMPKLEALS